MDEQEFREALALAAKEIRAAEEAQMVVVRATARALVDSVLELLQADPHSWSTRPCPTCRPISALIGRPFGCYKYAEQKGVVR